MTPRDDPARDGGCLAPDFTPAPYWWERTPRPEFPAATPPDRADVVVIGSGYTGLQAALQTARAGRHTVVLDSGDAGHGCSTRNGGQISPSLKPSYAELARKHGAERAHAILREGHNALSWIADFIAREDIACDFRRTGRFVGAHNPAGFRALRARHAAAHAPELPADLRVESHLVPPAEQRAELGTDAYHGGLVFPDHAGFDPGAYHAGLLAAVRAAGAEIHPHTEVRGLTRERDGVQVATARGPIRAREVVLATNGYTGPATPWHRRRVVPIGSYMIATEPLPPALMDRLMPKDRVVSDTRRVGFYYRASPDRRRILFGGRLTFGEADPRRSAPRLHRALVALFPELAGTKVTHAWRGFVAYSFDTLPHTGQRDGIHYALDYCGSGVSLSSYLGAKLGLKVIGDPDGRTGLDDLPVPTRPLYTGAPWFLPPTLLAYRALDRFV